MNKLMVKADSSNEGGAADGSFAQSGDNQQAAPATFGSRLRWAAITLVGTITEFSFLVRIAERNLHRYISGDVRPGSEILESIQKVGVSIDWLLSGEGCAFNVHARERLQSPDSTHTCCCGTERCPFDLPCSKYPSPQGEI